MQMLKKMMLVLLMLLCSLPVMALADDGWEIAQRLERWQQVRYDIKAPVVQGGSSTWTVKTRCTHDPSDENAFLVEIKVFENGVELTDAQVAQQGGMNLNVPYPANHDAAMGYTYTIKNQQNQAAIQPMNHIYQCIAFTADAAAPLGPYRISWGDQLNPRAASWELIMSRMNWEGSSYAYTVGAGSKKVTVTRSGSDVHISGGEIDSVVRFAVMDGPESYQAIQGWHARPGHYTLHNVTLLDDIYVWAQNGEDYTITLDASVKGSYGMLCALRNGANLQVINNDIICCASDYSMVIEADTTCTMSITGNGKIYIGNGWDWSDESATEMDQVPIRIVMLSSERTNEKALEDIRQVEGRIVVSYDQVKVAGGYPAIRSYCAYLPDPNDAYLSADVMDPQTGERYELDAACIIKKLRPGAGAMTEPLLSSAAELEEGALFRPLLVSSQDGNDVRYLRSQITRETGGSSIDYEIHVVDHADVKVPLSGQSDLYIPFPEGMDMQKAAGYEVTIVHATDQGEETFSTRDGSIQITPYGFKISVGSLSPFSLRWKAASLPPTGDHAPLALCTVLLLAAAVAAACLWRRMRTA